MKKDIKDIAVIGVGLIGGSLGLALRHKKNTGRVIGIGRNIGRLRTAYRMGAVDEYTTDMSRGVGFQSMEDEQERRHAPHSARRATRMCRDMLAPDSLCRCSSPVGRGSE